MGNGGTPAGLSIDKKPARVSNPWQGWKWHHDTFSGAFYGLNASYILDQRASGSDSFCKAGLQSGHKTALLMRAVGSVHLE